MEASNKRPLCPICFFPINVPGTLKVLIPTEWTSDGTNVAVLCSSCNVCIITGESSSDGVLSKMDTTTRKPCKCSGRDEVNFELIFLKNKGNPRCGTIKWKCSMCGRRRHFLADDDEDEEDEIVRLSVGGLSAPKPSEPATLDDTTKYGYIGGASMVPGVYNYPVLPSKAKRVSPSRGTPSPINNAQSDALSNLHQPTNTQPGYPTPEYPTPGYPTPGYPQPGYPTTEYPTTGYPTPGYPQPGYPTPGYPTPGYPTPGYPTPGYPTPGYSQPGYPQQSGNEGQSSMEPNDVTDYRNQGGSNTVSYPAYASGVYGYPQAHSGQPCPGIESSGYEHVTSQSSYSVSPPTSYNTSTEELCKSIETAEVQAVWKQSLQEASSNPNSCSYCKDPQKQISYFNDNGFVTYVLCTECGARTDWSVGDGKTTPKTLITNLNILKPADHVAWHRPCGIWHHAIIFDVDLKYQEVEVIHYNGGIDRIDDSFASIRRQWIPVDVADRDFYRIDYEPHECHPPDFVMARACQRLHETEYNPFTHNCEHFARWCKTGHDRSVQIERIPIRVQKTVDRLWDKLNSQTWFKSVTGRSDKAITSRDSPKSSRKGLSSKFYNIQNSMKNLAKRVTSK